MPSRDHRLCDLGHLPETLPRTPDVGREDFVDSLIRLRHASTSSTGDSSLRRPAGSFVSDRSVIVGSVSVLAIVSPSSGGRWRNTVTGNTRVPTQNRSLRRSAHSRPRAIHSAGRRFPPHAPRQVVGRPPQQELAALPFGCRAVSSSPTSLRCPCTHAADLRRPGSALPAVDARSRPSQGPPPPRRAFGDVEVLFDEDDCESRRSDALRTTSSISSMIVGASPSEGSSSSNTRGSPINARPMASICCWPPLRLEPRTARRERRAGQLGDHGFHPLVHVSLDAYPKAATRRLSNTLRPGKMSRP